MLRDEVIKILRSERFVLLTDEALAANEFFTRQSIETAARAIIPNIPTRPRSAEPNPRKIGVICAGNIPLVGFADTYNALLTNAEVYIKPSRRDPLMRIFENYTTIVDQLPTDIDVLAAMGSNATMDALKVHHPTARLILRGTEHSAAVLTGDETDTQIESLADDIFLHAGLGCRSVTHLHLPRGYDLSRLKFTPRGEALPTAWYDNYRHRKAISAMHGQQFIDGGFYMLKEGFQHDLTMIGYTFYDNMAAIDYGKDKLKCLVADARIASLLPMSPTDFGRAQFPEFEFIEF